MYKLSLLSHLNILDDGLYFFVGRKGFYFYYKRKTLHNWTGTRSFKQTIYPIGSFICQETLYKRMSTIKIEHRQEKIGMMLWYKNDKENPFNSHHMFSFNSKFMHWIKEKSPLLFVPSFKYSHLHAIIKMVFSIYNTFLVLNKHQKSSRHNLFTLTTFQTFFL